MWRMKSGWSVTAIVVLAMSAVPVAAQEQGDKPAAEFNWSRVRNLAPGTEIIVTVRGAPAPRQYVVLAVDESELTVLTLTDARLSRAARDVLRGIAANQPNYFAVADRRGSFVNGTVRVAPDGVFVADQKVADLGQVTEHIARADVAEITRPGGAPFTADRPVEIWVGTGGVMSFGGGGGDVRVTVTVPRSERRSIEGFVGIYRGNDFFDTRGVYGFQIKQQIARGRRPGFEPFATFGLMGIVARYESSDCLYASCQYHVSTHVLPPFLGLLGGGVQYTVTPRLAVRLEAQAGIALIIPVGVRVAAGVSVPLGRVTSRQHSRP